MPPSSTTSRLRNVQQSEMLDKERCLCCPDKALIEKTALRQHLTAVHPKALAKALLMPDPNNVEEQWLHRIAFQSIQADSCPKPTDNDKGKASKAKRKKNDQIAATTIKSAPLMLSNKRIRKPSLIVREFIGNSEIGRTNKSRGGRVKKEEDCNTVSKTKKRTDAQNQTPPSSPPKPLATTTQPSDEKSPQPHSTCRQCGERTERRANHVLVKHMNLPMYECPLCRFNSNYLEKTVVDHINTVHKSHGSLVPLDNRRRYSKVYQRLLMECFGEDADDSESQMASEDISSPRSSEEEKKVEEAGSEEQNHSATLRRTRTRNVKNRSELDDDAAVNERATSKNKSKRSNESDDDDDSPLRRTSRTSPRKRPRAELDDDDYTPTPPSTSAKKAAVSERAASKNKAKRPSESDDDDDNSPRQRTSSRTSSKKRPLAELDDDDDDYTPTPPSTSVSTKKISRQSISTSSFQQQPWAPNRPPPPIAADSAADLTNPAVCHMCRREVPLMRKRHVLQYHFPVAVYECSACEFISYAQPSVHKHIESAHEGADPPAVAVSHLADMAGEIADMQRKCFPLQAIRRVFKTRRKSLFKFSTVRAADGRDLIYCKLCDDGIKEKAFRHVLEHLDQPVYACRYCDETSPTDLTNIRKHSERNHPKETDQEPLVHIANYQADIDTLYEQCFEKVPRQADERLFKRKVPAKRTRKPKKTTDWQT